MALHVYQRCLCLVPRRAVWLVVQWSCRVKPTVKKKLTEGVATGHVSLPFTDRLLLLVTCPKCPFFVLLRYRCRLSVAVAGVCHHNEHKRCVCWRMEAMCLSARRHGEFPNRRRLDMLRIAMCGQIAVR